MPIGDGRTGDSLTYDDELLDAHYMAGDGRVNENIGLTAVHPDLPLRAQPPGRPHQGRPSWHAATGDLAFLNRVADA